jgi:metal-responsive CopG/Arc/MetJ family transcriptional regulator
MQPMRITLSIPDALAHRFRVAVPPRQRSRLVSRLLETSLAEHEDALAAACRAANRDKALERETEEWQSFEDGVRE